MCSTPCCVCVSVCCVVFSSSLQPVSQYTKRLYTATSHTISPRQTIYLLSGDQWLLMNLMVSGRAIERVIILRQEVLVTFVWTGSVSLD